MDTILFDLDGTLLPLDQEQFLKEYFGRMSKMIATKGIDPKPLTKAIWIGTDAMIKNDGSMTNEERFWRTFEQVYDGNVQEVERLLDRFYEQEFDKVKVVADRNPLARTCVDRLKKKGYTLALTTNPVFPAVATRHRIRWAGLRPEDFALVTTFENSSHAKPNLAYYKSVLDQLEKNPEDCTMVGNDVVEDLCVSELGIETFLVTDHLIEREGVVFSHHRQGSFEDLIQWIDTLPDLT